jgi:hypothetical protein
VNTNTLFDAGEGEGDVDVGDSELDMSDFTASPMQMPKGSACDLDPAPSSPIANDFMLAVRTLKGSLLEPAGTPAGP